MATVRASRRGISSHLGASTKCSRVLSRILAGEVATFTARRSKRTSRESVDNPMLQPLPRICNAAGPPAPNGVIYGSWSRILRWRFQANGANVGHSASIPAATPYVLQLLIVIEIYLFLTRCSSRRWRQLHFILNPYTCVCGDRELPKDSQNGSHSTVVESVHH